VDRVLFGTALLLGAIAVFWIGLVFVDSNALAFTVTAVIGGVYGIGCAELLKFENATSTLAKALCAANEKIDDLNKWLDGLDPSLHNAVRLRIEGERVGLPAPILTPYLVGLLVMLGLLGTFVGMVDTLRGAVMVIEGTAELQAIRDGLAAPIKGLGLAFGTSVAGIATSAMLGLMSTLCRRRRMLETRQLDTKIPTVFQAYSLIHHQRETFSALRLQTHALPEVVDKLDAMADKLGGLGEVLIENQNLHYTSVRANFAELINSMDKAFKENLTENIRLAGEAIQPLLQNTLTGFTQEMQKAHERLNRFVEENIEAVSRRSAAQSDEIVQSWKAGLEAHHHSNDELIERMHNLFSEYFRRTAGEFAARAQTAAAMMQDELALVLQSSEKLIDSRIETEVAWIEGHRHRMDRLGSAMRDDLIALRDDEERRGQAALERLEKLEAVVTSHLTTLGQALETPISRLIKTASEAPRAAAKVIDLLRQEALKRVHSDNQLLEEHQRLIETLNTLLTSLSLSSTEQCKANEQLVNASKIMMEDVGRRFAEQVDSKVTAISKVADTFAGSAVEMASLGDAFRVAMDLFSAANGDLIENLARIEESLDKATTRSDDQLGYYVAQAREMIDHSILSQKQIIDALRQLALKNGTHPEVC
jgi:hypothetical protein